VTEKLPTIEELRAEIIIELTCDTEDERDDCIDAKLLNDRLAVAEAVREACRLEAAASLAGFGLEIAGRIAAIDLAAIVKGNP